MKKLHILLVFALLFSGCFEYEEEESVVTYGSFDFELSDALREDYGAHSGEHYNMDFSFIGESYTFDENSTSGGQIYFTFNPNIDCYIFLELFSPGTESFNPVGEYQKLGDRELDEVKGEFVYRRLFFGRTQNEAIPAEDGTVTITVNSAGLYRIKFDIVLANERILKGSFIGVPKYLDQR